MKEFTPYLSPKFYNDGVDIPHVRFDHHGYAHTTNSLGNQTVHDVWHDRVEKLGGPIVPGVRGYKKEYEEGGYRFGYHKFRF